MCYMYTVQKKEIDSVNMKYNICVYIYVCADTYIYIHISITNSLFAV